MSEQRPILCDVDGVLLDIHEHWLDTYGRRTGDHLTHSDYDFGKKARYPQVLYTCLHELAPQLYSAHVRPTRPWVLAELQWAQEQCGAPITFVTYAPLGEWGNFEAEAALKLHWLRQWVPNTLRWSYVASADTNKLYHEGSLLIEDRIETLEGWVARHETRGALIRQPWNEHYRSTLAIRRLETRDELHRLIAEVYT